MALEDHALIKLDGAWIPLIGVPPSAAKEECDLCHDVLPLQHVEFNGKQFLCSKCSEQRRNKQCKHKQAQ